MVLTEGRTLRATSVHCGSQQSSCNQREVDHCSQDAVVHGRQFQGDGLVNRNRLFPYWQEHRGKRDLQLGLRVKLNARPVGLGVDSGTCLSCSAGCLGLGGDGPGLDFKDAQLAGRLSRDGMSAFSAAGTKPAGGDQFPGKFDEVGVNGLSRLDYSIAFRFQRAKRLGHIVPGGDNGSREGIDGCGWFARRHIRVPEDFKRSTGGGLGRRLPCARRGGS